MDSPWPFSVHLITMTVQISTWSAMHLSEWFCEGSQHVSMKTAMASGVADTRWQKCSTIAMAHCTNSGGTILCESLRVPYCLGAIAERSSGLRIWTAQSPWITMKGSWVELQRVMDLGRWFTSLLLYTLWPRPEWLCTCCSAAAVQGVSSCRYISTEKDCNIE